MKGKAKSKPTPYDQRYNAIYLGLSITNKLTIDQLDKIFLTPDVPSTSISNGNDAPAYVQDKNYHMEDMEHG